MDLEKQAEQFRQVVAQAGPRGRTTAYPAELREDAVRYVRARVAEGGTAGGACRELGIGTDTFRRWSAARGTARAIAPAVFRAVKITAAQSEARPAGRIIVHCPGGLRIEGLDMAALAELIRRLG